MEKENVTQETIIMERPKPVENKKPKKKLKLNIQGIVGAIILIVIAVIIFQIVRSFADKSGSPVGGKRFENALSDKIDKNELQQLKTRLLVNGVEQVEINLTSATVRMNIDIKDDLKEEQAKRILEESTKVLAEKYPIEKYFSNRGDVKMYDYEIHVYNVVKPKEKVARVYVMGGKSAAGKAYTEVLSRPKNEKVAKEVTEERKP